MRQTSTVLVKVLIEYDDDVMTESQAQERWLGVAPGEPDGRPGWEPVYTEIIAGYVDDDGLEVTPRSLPFIKAVEAQRVADRRARAGKR